MEARPPQGPVAVPPEELMGRMQDFFKGANEGISGTEVPSWVHWRSPGREPGGLRSPEAEVS